jgi:RNA polymerase sigma factor (sigma-70 family)
MRQTDDLTADGRSACTDADVPYPPALHRYLIRQMRNRDDARDLAQEAYLRYLQLPDTAAVRDPSAYLFRIAFNLISEWRLAEGRAKTAPAAGPAAVEQLISRERLERILEQIPLNYRRVLLMSKCDGLSNRQIADALNVTPATVVRYLGRAVAFARRARWD